MIRSYSKLILTSSTCAVLIATLNVMANPRTTANTDFSVPIKIHLHNGKDKIVQLQKINFSAAQRKKLANNVTLTLKKPYYLFQKSSELPASIEDGMNNIPVLDQGKWGTCATFAATAALDALYGLQGNKSISQLCNLELGRTIQNPDETGGWEGSFGYLILQQIEKYGYVPKLFEKSKVCGGLAEYPVDNPFNNGDPMPVDLFLEDSVKSFSAADWKPILFFKGDFDPISPDVGAKALDDVKHYLLKGDRVLFGTVLDPNVGDAGAIGKYDAVDADTWVLTDAIKRSIEQGEIAGHEMVIIGYDDNACAEYDEVKDDTHMVKKQCGILHLRNSWSELAGDKGDYYMTYDYFKTMALEVYAIGKGVNTN